METTFSPTVQAGALQTPTAGDVIESGKTLQQVQTQYTTAVKVQEPRQLKKIIASCIEEAAYLGEDCFYGWGSGKDRIEGPTIRCAMIAVRLWGNTAIDMDPIQETRDSYIMAASFVDLETGFTLKRQFRQSKKWNVSGKMDEFRKEDVRFQIGQSKAQRNVILNALPSWLIDKMIEKAKEGVREKLEVIIKNKGIEHARKLCVDALSKYSVKVEDIERKYEKKYPAWDIETLITLSGDIAALTKGQESASVLFPPDGEKTDVETGEITKPDDKPFNATAGDAANHQDIKTGKPKDGKLF